MERETRERKWAEKVEREEEKIEREDRRKWSGKIERSENRESHHRQRIQA